jgi:hypothetical protein
MSHVYDTETLQHKGRAFSVVYECDLDHGAPWEESDGHGIVSEWTTRDKEPGELVLMTDGRSHRFYDVTGTLRLAKKDGWGTSDGRQPGESAATYTARAVDEDFTYLRAWCVDQWCYVGVVVTLLDDRGKLTDIQESLWGVETWKNYHETIALELADDIMRRVEVDTPDVQLSEN